MLRPIFLGVEDQGQSLGGSDAGARERGVGEFKEPRECLLLTQEQGARRDACQHASRPIRSAARTFPTVLLCGDGARG